MLWAPRAAAAALLVILGGCDSSTPPDQVAVQGDGFEITLAELEQVLRQAPPQPKERVAPARREILNGLIDEKLLAEAAVESGLDKNTDTVQAVEAARRAILAQAYVAKVINSPQAPDDATLMSYYNSHPDLYGGRMRLRVSEVTMPLNQASESSVSDLDKLGFNKFVAKLASEGKPADVTNASIMSDQIGGKTPPVGATVVYRTQDQLHLGTVTAADPVPVSFDEAKASIAQRINAEQTGQRVAEVVAKMRKDRKVKVVNKDLQRGMT